MTTNGVDYLEIRDWLQSERQVVVDYLARTALTDDDRKWINKTFVESLTERIARAEEMAREAGAS